MFYLYFLALSVVEILWESWISIRNSRALRQKGAVEVAPILLSIMVVLYAVMYFGSLAEFLLLSRQPSPLWILTFAMLFCLAKILKFWAIKSLGHYWTMRVLILPESKTVTTGPYKWIRHPNYVAVLLEIAATTLMGKCFYTFAVVIVLFSITLVFRIRREEAALRRWTDYASQMEIRGRFVP